MSVECGSGNATAPSPAIRPGGEDIDARRAAERVAARGMDPRILAAVPAFDAPFFQAGLAGYSDAAMRLIARRHGCPFCVTEALLDRTLLAGGRGFAKADLGELHENVPGGPDDHPLACQIMGSDPREMAAAALKAAEQGRQGDTFYRALAYTRPGVLPSTHAGDRLRLPGGEQLPVFDPAEGLGDDAGRGSIGGGGVGGGGVGGGGDTCETLVDEINQIDGEDASEWPSDEANREARPGASPRAPLISPRRHSGIASLQFETIDVNLACPVKKIKSKARGGHWLAEPRGAIRLLEAVREAVPSSVPCTVKLRRAFDDTPEMAANCDLILDAARSLGYVWATVHARTVQQKYTGPSRWDLLRGIVRRHPGIVILGSGDVWDAGEIFRMVEYTGVSAAAVARGCIGNPWVFRQAREMMAGRAPAAPTLAEQRDVLTAHYALLLRVNAGMRHAEEATSKQMRKFAIRFAAHHPRADDARRAFLAVSSHDEWARVLESFYSPAALE